MRLLVGDESKLAKSLLLDFPEEYFGVTGRANNFHDLRKKVSQKLEEKFVSEILYFPAITNPTLPVEQIFEINAERPTRLIEEFGGKVKFVTFGTVLESARIQNPYVESKRNLATIASVAGNLHVRLNTLYDINFGLKEHMFLAQLVNRAKNGIAFQMTSGMQYREYHRYNQVSRYIHNSIASSTGILEISNGKGFLLKTLAERVFELFNQSKNLLIGDERPMGEQYTQRVCTLEKNFGDITGDLAEVLNNLREFVR